MKNLVVKLYILIALLAVAPFIQAQSLADKELKVEVNKIEHSTLKLKKLQPITFKYNLDKYKYLKLPKGDQYGFLAENVAQVFPAMVYESSVIHHPSKGDTKVAKYTAINNEDLIPVLVEAIKEQQEQIDALRKEITALKGNKLSGID